METVTYVIDTESDVYKKFLERSQHGFRSPGESSLYLFVANEEKAITVTNGCSATIRLKKTDQQGLAVATLEDLYLVDLLHSDGLMGSLARAVMKLGTKQEETENAK